MPQLQPSTDITNTVSQTDLNTQDIASIIDELNRGIDPTGIASRAILASQIRILSYVPNPVKIHPLSTLAAGATSDFVINFLNTGLTAAGGQTFLPTVYIDIFVDPPDTSSTANIYSASFNNIFPDGLSVSGTGLEKLRFNWYLRNSTPSSNNAVVSIVISIQNNDSSAHSYYASITMDLPADGNLQSGSSSVFLP